MAKAIQVTEQELLNQFKREVFDNRHSIDPDNEHDWMSLAVGYFLAMGCTASRAHEFATPACLGTTLLPKSYG